MVPTVRHAWDQYMRGPALQRPDRRMIRLFLLPGDLLCNAFGLKGESDHRQVLRSFFNMMIWSAVGIGIVLKLAL